MTIRMQEAEFFSNRDQVMQHLAAGDEVQLERDGILTATVVPKAAREPRHIDEVLDRLRARANEHGPAVMDECFAKDVRNAHERLSRRTK